MAENSSSNSHPKPSCSKETNSYSKDATSCQNVSPTHACDTTCGDNTDKNCPKHGVDGPKKPLAPCECGKEEQPLDSSHCICSYKCKSHGACKRQEKFKKRNKKSRMNRKHGVSALSDYVNEKEHISRYIPKTCSIRCNHPLELHRSDESNNSPSKTSSEESKPARTVKRKIIKPKPYKRRELPPPKKSTYERAMEKRAHEAAACICSLRKRKRRLPKYRHPTSNCVCPTFPTAYCKTRKRRNQKKIQKKPNDTYGSGEANSKVDYHEHCHDEYSTKALHARQRAERARARKNRKNKTRRRPMGMREVTDEEMLEHDRQYGTYGTDPAKGCIIL